MASLLPTCGLGRHQHHLLGIVTITLVLSGPFVKQHFTFESIRGASRVIDINARKSWKLTIFKQAMSTCEGIFNKIKSIYRAPKKFE